jgi:hypothetical protein
MSLVESIVYYTNKYKRDQGNVSPDVTNQEMLRFIGLMIAHAVCTWHSIKENWKKTSKGPFSPGTYGNYLPRHRYEIITKYLHFCDNSQQRYQDRFYKIRLLLDCLSEKFDEAYELGTHCSFDEGTWATKSKYCPSKQFNSNKPHKWGLKVFMLCCATTGFCTRFEVYQGRNQGPDLKAGPSALYRNVQHLAGSKRVIFCDRYYTTIGLFIKLLNINLYAVGTVKTNVSGFPQQLKVKQTGSMKRGDSRSLLCKLKGYGDLFAVAWMDKKPVYLISTAYMNEPCTVQRQVGREKVDLESVHAIQMYQSYMGGVDLNDFLRQAIYCIQSKMKFRKWYKMCFAAAVDLAVTNAFILFKMTSPRNEKAKISHAEFLQDLCVELLTYNVSTPGSRSSTPRATRSTIANLQSSSSHIISEFESGYGHSGGNYDQNVCFIAGCKRTTKFYCQECGDAPACNRSNEKYNNLTCFNVLHTDPSAIKKVQKRLESLSKRTDK